jgi:hypothetical protein
VAGRLTLLHYPDFLHELQTQGITIHEDELDFDAPTRRVLAICDALQLSCVDAGPRFRRLGLRAFFPHDEHPTALGHEALAEALLEAHK